ncbi:solute carrier family 35 member E1 homolog [Plodia interpunctella]|uniref:solute carrier family 35 member E1 homolog n=1 Tax=Plodia interpunctella TaxID=58824 RepID=UPI0023682367|nr:solute carrier family 35 member E1 homolog [Plodia interpunctella]
MGLEGSRREALVVCGLCAAWYTVSSASNVVGKLVLTEFPFPVTVSMVQLLSIVVYSAPAFRAAGVRRTPDFPRRYFWRVLVPLAWAKFFTTMFSQISIWKVPISYAHTVKATTPLWTAGLAFVLFGERQPRAVAGALLLIAAGVAVASATELQFDALGLGAALAAAALLSLQHLFSKRVMRDTGVHHLRLLQLLGRLALLLFLPVWLWRDGTTLWQEAAWLHSAHRTMPLLALDGLLAWLQAVAAFSVLSRVSPLAYAVASAAKRAAVVAASLLVLRNPASAANLAGMALAAAGVLLYNRAKLRARSDLATPLLPV